ncbi:MAG: D-glycero-beta-D-manno-heptose-7-phosphate kinase [Pyrinomonadaceae bacterium]
MPETLQNFNDVKVLVLGDVMLDQYWWGNVDRISPEAPVPIVALNKKSTVAGGAANVAANISGLGAVPILVGIIGNDAEGAELRKILRSINVSAENLKISGQRPTTVKTRIIANNQQVVRLDREDPDDIEYALEDELLAQAAQLIPQTDVVLISDYAKGIVTARVVSEVIGMAKENKKPILIDPKGKDYSKYTGANVLTPNQKEALDAAGLESTDEETIRIAGEKLVSDHKLQNLVITRGEKGMALFGSTPGMKRIETVARRVYDVTGAGDTVISTMAVATGAGTDFETACLIANAAAGIVVERLGTTPVSVEELEKNLVL